MAAAAFRSVHWSTWLARAGLAVMAVAFVWWFLFYAQWAGPLHMLDLKIACLATTIDECRFFQMQMQAHHVWGPVYQPIVWWIGVVAFITGTFLPRASKPNGAGK
jgi:hypothetical protein